MFLNAWAVRAINKISYGTQHKDINLCITKCNENWGTFGKSMGYSQISSNVSHSIRKSMCIKNLIKIGGDS